MATKYKSLVEITNKKQVIKGGETVKIIEGGEGYSHSDDMECNPLIEEVKQTEDFDLRLQQRFITRGNWCFEDIDTFKKNIPNKAQDVVPFKSDQPALGLFDEETLKRVQKNFPYKIKIRDDNDN